MSATALESILNREGITVKVIKSRGRNVQAPQWAKDRQQYLCLITYEDRAMSLWYYTGSHFKEAKPGDVIECLVSDYSFKDMSEGEYMDEMGVSIRNYADYTGAQLTYKQLMEQNKQFGTLIGRTNLMDELSEAIYS